VTDLLVATAAGLRRPGAETELEGRSLVGLASEAERRWALAGDGTILRSEEDGWEEVARLTEPAPRCLLPTDEGVLVGTALARLFRLRRDVLEPVEAFDEAPGRDGWYTPWGGPPDTRSLALDQSGTVYANVHVGGIVRSTSEGGWEPTIDVDADVHQVIAHPERDRLVLAATAYGLARSTDGGANWETADDGLHAPYCRAVTVAGETVLVTASTGPSTRRAAIYRRPLEGGGPLERCGGGLPEWFPSNIDSHCLAASGRRVAFGTAAGELWASEDEGGTWERVEDGLPPVRAVLVSAEVSGG
jgi:hypothetical protein